MQVWQSFLNGYFGKSGARRVPQVDSLRGVAALLIFFVHYYALMGHWFVAGSAPASFAGMLESIAHSGTDLFFTLSGYLIYGSLMRRKQQIGPYLLRRFGRIYPTFLFVVGGYLLIFAIDPADSKLPSDSVDAALYVLANLLLLPGILEIEPIVAPAWSLSYLAVYYIAAPFMVYGLNLRQWRGTQRVALFAVLAAMLLLSGAIYHGPVRMAMFIGGMLLYELHARAPTGRPRLGLALFAAAALVMAAITALDIPPVIRYLALLILLPAACGAFLEASIERGWLSWNWLRYLGRITLSYIMVHGLALHVFLYGVEHAAPPSWQGATLFWALVLPAFIFSAATAAILYILVEDPAA